MPENETGGLVYASLILRGKELDPQAITDAIRINPTRSFKRGDKRKDDKKWPHGYWELSSKDYVNTSDTASHINWVILQIYASIDEWKHIVGQEDLDAVMSCLLIFSTNHEVITLDSEMLQKLASLNLKIEFDMYTFN